MDILVATFIERAISSNLNKLNPSDETAYLKKGGSLLWHHYYKNVLNETETLHDAHNRLLIDLKRDTRHTQYMKLYIKTYGPCWMIA